MKNSSFIKAFLLLLVAVAAAAHNPHDAGGLRTNARPLHKNRNNQKHPIPNRNLENHKKFHKKRIPKKHKPKPPSRHLEPETLDPATFVPWEETWAPWDPAELCREAKALKLDETVQVKITDYFVEKWFSVAGTGGYLAVSTCTGGDSTSTSFEAYFDIYKGSCDDLDYVTYADSWDGCETAYMETLAREEYYVAAYGYSYGSDSTDTFGLTVYEVDELPNTVCEGATALELEKSVEGEISEQYGMAWYSFVGTGENIVISTCTGNGQLDNKPFDSVIEVMARDCDDLRYIDYDDEGGKCGKGKSTVILPSVKDLTYHVSVSEYMGMTGSFGLKISKATA